MSINIRRVGEVADGSITEIKLADGAVDLESDKVVGELPSIKLADAAVVEAKIAVLAVKTGHLQDDCVTLAKSSDDVAVSHFVGDETEVLVLGDTETEMKTLSYTKQIGYKPTKIRFVGTLKTSDAAKMATMNVYWDAEVAPRLTMTSVDLAYEIVSDEADISDLENGKHTMHVCLVNAAVDGTSYNDMIDLMFIKG